MAKTARRRVRPEAVAGIAVGTVLLTGVAALAVGGWDDPSQDRPPGSALSQWARDHHGPPPWAQGRPKGDKGERDDKDDRAEKGDRFRHGPPPWARGWGRDGDKDRKGPPPWAHGHGREHKDQDDSKADQELDS